MTTLKGTHHRRDELERTHADADVLIIDAFQDILLIFCHHLRMAGDDANHGEQRNVFHLVDVSACLSYGARRTVLVVFDQETTQFLYADSSEGIACC